MQEEVKSMLEKQAIDKDPPMGRVSYPQFFSSSKGQRSQTSLKAMNRFVHFKMEGIHVLRDPLKAGDLMEKEELKDAYFMILIHKEIASSNSHSRSKRTSSSVSHWPSMHTLDLHHDPEANRCSVETAGNANDRIYKRVLRV